MKLFFLKAFISSLLSLDPRPNSLAWFVLCCAQSCPTVCIPINCSPLGPSLSLGFSRQEYWSGLPFLSTGDLPNPGIKPVSLVPQHVESYRIGGWTRVSWIGRQTYLRTKPPGKPSGSLLKNLFFFFFWLCSTWDRSFLTRDWKHLRFNLWTTSLATSSLLSVF